MKKYLICGALALMTGLVVTSCTHDEDLYENVDSVEKKTEDFRKAFKQAFGTIASNQDWGFDRTVEYEETPTAATRPGNSKAGTRGANVNGNLWYQEWERPTNVTDEEKKVSGKVIQEFSKQRVGEVNAITINWNNYWVQQVYQSNNSYKDGNGNSTGDIHVKMNKIIAYNSNTKTEEVWWPEHKVVTVNGYYEHVNNFNDGTNTTVYTDDETNEKYYGTTLMQDMGAVGSNAQFGYHNTIDSKDHFEYIVLEIDGYYYVGFDFCASHPDGQEANKNMDVERDWIFNDWIVRICPAIRKGASGVETTEEEQPEDQIEYRYEYTYETTVGQSTTRIFCEDLGSSYSSRADFDYNDAVFDATLFERRYKMLTYTVHYQTLRGVEVEGSRYENKDETVTTWDVIKPDGAEDGQTQEQRPRYFAKIDLYAAGGTIPLKIFDEEIHEAFGVGETTMVNTFDSNSENHTIKDEKSGKTISAFGSHTYIEPPVRLKNTYTAKPAAVVSGEASDTNYPLDYLFELAPDTTQDGRLVKPNLINIPIYTRFAGSGVTILQSDRGDAPHKIAVPTNTRWTSERCDIADAYADFSSYVSGQSAPWSSGNDNYLYSEERSVSNYVKGQTSSTTYSEGSDTEQAYYVNADGFDVSQGLYLTGTNILSGLAEGDRIRVHVKEVQSGYILILSSGDAARINVDQSQVAGKESGFIDFGLTAAMISKLTSGNDNANLILSGSGLKVTRIGVVRKK